MDKDQIIGGEICHVHVKVDHAGYWNNRQNGTKRKIRTVVNSTNY